MPQPAPGTQVWAGVTREAPTAARTSGVPLVRSDQYVLCSVTTTEVPTVAETVVWFARSSSRRVVGVGVVGATDRAASAPHAEVAARARHAAKRSAEWVHGSAMYVPPSGQ